MFLGFFLALADPQFHSAYSRTLKYRQALQSRLADVEIVRPFDRLSLALFSKPANYFKVNHKIGSDVYQVVVGYGPAGNDIPVQEEKVIQLLSGWLRRIFQEADGYSAKREELVEIVDNWESEVVKRVMDVRAAGNLSGNA